jgi:hypothetical protein
MDAPKGRYRVEEKDGRLTVIDTETGAPIPSPGLSASGAPPRQGGPIAPPPPGLFDRLGRLLLHLAVRSWDEQGRAVIAWQWEQNGRRKRWDATLGPAHQRRLGRALLAFSAFPLVVLLSIFLAPFWLLLPFALPATFWGAWSVARIRRETAAGGAPHV